MKKNLIAKLVVLGLVLTMLPTVAFAAQNRVDGIPSDKNTPYYYDEDAKVYYYYTEDTTPPVPPASGSSTPSTPAAEDVTKLPDEPTTEITKITVEGDKAELEVKVVEGVAYATVTEEALNVEVKGDTLTLTVKAEGAKKVYVDLPGAALAKLGKAVTMESDVATITIPSSAMTGALKDAKTVTLAAAVSDSGAYSIAVMADGKAVTKDIKGLVVKF